MRTFVPVMFDEKKHAAIAVPAFMTVVPSAPDELIVEGKAPDTGTWKVNHHVRLTFFLVADKIKRTCKKSERYQFGPGSNQAGRKVGHGGWCRTD